MKKYFYSNGNEKHGPFSYAELGQEGITRNSLIWYEGLDDWTPAHEVVELIPILEVQPPPMPIFQTQIRNNDILSTNIKEASEGWVIVGFILSLLGGIIGIAMGANYAFGNYRSKIKLYGWIMMILGFLSTIIWKIM